MALVSQQQLQMLAEKIAQVVNPVRVILFGSQARGTANERSDIDLLIINDPPSAPNWSKRRDIGKIRRSIPSMGVPVDVLLYTTEEVGRWKNTTNHIISEAYQEGKVLYERP